ncbi:MAG: hypothetical protein GX591_13180 [Planctomycetes bacterium]|nr:hypothetical protein [Planctomycetota bacterium]
MKRTGIIVSALLAAVAAAPCLGTEGQEPRTPAEAADAVTVPEAWRDCLEAGPLTVAGGPFYGVIEGFGMIPVVPVRWSLRNLTDQTLYVEMGYGSRNPNGPGGTGMSVSYVLAPHEDRSIRDTAAVFSVAVPAKLRVGLDGLRLPGRTMDPPSRRSVVEGVALPPSPGRAAVFAFDGPLAVKHVRLTHAPEQGNRLEVLVANPTGRRCIVGVQVAVGDPARSDPALVETPLARSRGAFVEQMAAVEPGGESLLALPYRVPSDAGEAPALAYRVFEERGPIDADLLKRLALTERDVRHPDRPLIQAGGFDLAAAAAAGLAVLPPCVPVKERAKLTIQTASEHFLFRYRPDSFAAGNIESIIEVREAAYERLRGALDMDLPFAVTIDLYPDMEAKSLGSGTTWTPANTVNSRHIAEVCNETCQCDAAHEVAHLFSFQFGSGGDRLCEAFAVRWEQDVDLAAYRRRAAGRVADGTAADPLGGDVSEEAVTFVDCLMRRDLASFKAFMAACAREKTSEELDRAARAIYGAGLDDMRRWWREDLAAAEPRDGETSPNP